MGVLEQLNYNFGGKLLVDMVYPCKITFLDHKGKFICDKPDRGRIVVKPGTKDKYLLCYLTGRKLEYDKIKEGALFNGKWEDFIIPYIDADNYGYAVLEGRDKKDPNKFIMQEKNIQQNIDFVIKKMKKYDYLDPEQDKWYNRNPQLLQWVFIGFSMMLVLIGMGVFYSYSGVTMMGFVDAFKSALAGAVAPLTDISNQLATIVPKIPDINVP